LPPAVHRILLVTSGYHLARAVRAFTAEGFEVLPAAADRRAEESDEALGRWWPSAGALADTQRALKEYLGLLATTVGV
jgi:uncharacterized SAM-binding protein YcdF (DUF218 family)